MEAIMLNGIHLVDFGNHRNTRLTFGTMTALVGQNGSGKTTVMRAKERSTAFASILSYWRNRLRTDSIEPVLQKNQFSLLGGLSVGAEFTGIGVWRLMVLE